MKLSELIAAVGDENVAFQMLSESIHGTQKAGKGSTTHITFSTNQTTLMDLISPRSPKVGIVVWLPRDKMHEAVKRAEARERHEHRKPKSD